MTMGVAILLSLVCVATSATPTPCSPRLERSYWLHASLGSTTHKGYWGWNLKPTDPPSREEVRNAARLLGGPYAANRLYLIYHHEMPIEAARQVFAWWRESLPADVEIVPALVLRMYDKAQSPVFTEKEAGDLVEFFREKLHCEHVAVYDVYPGRNQGDALKAMETKYRGKILRVGLQPDEDIRGPFAGGVIDTWSGFCQGTRNVEDWRQPGFGAETLERWVRKRNDATTPVAWDLIVVAWDYRATPRGVYPGYDDATKNQPLPAGRNRLAVELIRRTARPGVLAGFSSDLFILHENSRAAAHDGPGGAFYETLKQGRSYRGYYGVPFQEVTEIYRGPRDER